MKNKFINCIVETGNNYHKKILGVKTLQVGVLRAFTLFPPKNPGILTRVREDIPINWEKNEGVWNYIDTEIMLKKAGYKVFKE